MDELIYLPFLAIFLFFTYLGFRRFRFSKRQEEIEMFRFPSAIKSKVKYKYPHLTEQQIDKVILGLREYFHLCNIAGKNVVSMPSQVVDVAWHEFILYTRRYQLFCRTALGRFLHHTPAEAMESKTIAQAGIKRAWKVSCYRESIEPTLAHKLPLLFAIDAELEIPDGFKYALNCLNSSKSKTNEYCATHIGCGSGCGSGCSGDSSSDESGCGGGCGGD